MKYRHAYHAGNFADVHKHVTLLTLLAALGRKEKGFLYLETHAGRGAYEISGAGESAGGFGKLDRHKITSPELVAYLEAVGAWRVASGRAQGYPGSPLLAAGALRAQDRAVLVELQPPEASALETALTHADPRAKMRVERGDGFERLRAFLPPAERRGLTFLDPPYEESEDFVRVSVCMAEALRRFPGGCVAVWYPIKDERTVTAWLEPLARSLPVEALACELWLYPRDSRVSLNGSGILIANPPYLVEEQAQVWLPELHGLLAGTAGSGCSVRRVGGTSLK